MSDGQIKIRLSAAQDSASFDRAFGDITKRAQRAGKEIQRAFGTGSTSSAGLAGPLIKGFDAAERAAQRAARASDALARQQSRGLFQQYKAQETAAERSARAQIRSAERAAKERVRIEERANKEIERAFRSASREAEREEAKRTRSAERELSKRQRVREQFASRVSHRATRFLFPPPMGILGAAGRVANGILHGAGIDTSIQGGVGRAITLNSSAVGLSNQERIATGQTRGAGFYENLARSTGDKYSQNPESVVDLLRSFTGKTGNFDAAGKMSDQLTSISVASGANLTEMGDAAGYVYNQLKNIPGAADKTIAVMRGIVGQTAVGAVEMKDYATQMGRVAANAQSFEGDVASNILKLSALTQLNIESGGATSAADAARGTVAFANTTGKAARIKAFSAAGVPIFTDDKVVNGKVVAGARRDTKRDPFELLKDSFRATQGNIPQLATMYADVLGRKSITALSGDFKRAGGGEAGIDAITKSLDKYMRANLSADTEKKNIEDFQNSPAAKAQRFQNNLDKVVATMAERVIPALERLKDPAIALATIFGKIVAFAAENPFKAMAIAGSAAIVRAFAETSFRTGIERAIMGGGLGPGARSGGPGLPGTALATGAPGGGSFMGITGGGLGVLGNTVAALQIGTAAIGAWYAGTAYIDSLVAKDVENQQKDAIDNAQAGVLESKLITMARDSSRSATPEEKSKLEGYQNNLGARIDAAQGYKDTGGGGGGVLDPVFDLVNNIATLGDYGDAQRKAELDSSHLGELKAEFARNANILADIRGGVLRVEVVNQPSGGNGGGNGTGSTSATPP